jgi:beta-glucosidase-like glycosyl hydrolase
VTSDCGAIENIYQEHKYTKDGPSAAAVSVKAGTDVDCGSVYKNSLGAAVKKSLVSVALSFIFFWLFSLYLVKQIISASS